MATTAIQKFKEWIEKHKDQETRKLVTEVLNARAPTDLATNGSKRMFDEHIKDAIKRIRPR